VSPGFLPRLIACSGHECHPLLPARPCRRQHRLALSTCCPSAAHQYRRAGSARPASDTAIGRTLKILHLADEYTYVIYATPPDQGLSK